MARRRTPPADPPADPTPPAAPAPPPSADPPADQSPPAADDGAPAPRRAAAVKTEDADYWRKKYERERMKATKTKAKAPTKRRAAAAAPPSSAPPSGSQVAMAVKTPPLPREPKRRLIRANKPATVRLFG